MQIECMPGKVAVILDPPDETLAGGLIYKPDTVKGDNHIGTIISIPNEMKLSASTDPPDRIVFCVNDRVVVPRYAGSPVVIEGREIIFLKSTDVLARLTCELAHAGHD